MLNVLKTIARYMSWLNLSLSPCDLVQTFLALWNMPLKLQIRWARNYILGRLQVRLGLIGIVQSILRKVQHKKPFLFGVAPK